MIRRNNTKNDSLYHRRDSIKNFRALRNGRMRRLLSPHRVLLIRLLSRRSICLNRRVRHLRGILQRIPLLWIRKVRTIIGMIKRMLLQQRVERSQLRSIFIIARSLNWHRNKRNIIQHRIRMLSRKRTTRIMTLRGKPCLFILNRLRRTQTDRSSLRAKMTIMTLTRLATPQ